MLAACIVTVHGWLTIRAHSEPQILHPQNGGSQPMSVTRRTFLKSTTYAGAALVIADALNPAVELEAEPNPLSPYLTGQRMAATPASAYRAYRSKVVSNPETTTWVQLDLGSSLPIDFIQLFPASERMYPGRDQYYGGEGFPLRFKIETSDEAEFSQAKSIADFTQSDFPDPTDNITRYAAHAQKGRYVRLTATKLRPVKVAPSSGTWGTPPLDGPDYTLTLAKISVFSGTRDAALGCNATADEPHGNPELLKQLTRAPREDGEEIRIDHPYLVSDAASWKRVPFKAEAPRSGVTLDAG